MNRKHLFWASLSGILPALAFPPYPFTFLAFIGLIPILYIFETEKEVKHKYKLIYTTFFFYHTLTNWWIGSWQSETDPYLMASGIVLCFAHPFIFLFPFVFYFYIKKKLGSNAALWSFPAAWIAFEWVHGLGEASYPWLTLGNTQIYNRYWVQIIDITGVWGASFLIVLANVIILKMLLNYSAFGSKKSIKMFFTGKNKYLTVSLLLLFLLPNIYGAFRFAHFDHQKMLKSQNTINIGLVQPSINPWRKWEGKGIEQVLLHQRLQDSLLAKVGRIDLFIWSETAIPTISISVNQGHFYPFLQEWIDKNQISLMTGFSEYYIYPTIEEAPITARKWILDSNELWEPFNSALMLNPAPFDYMNPQLYRKSKLTPFAERFPYSDKLTFAQSWLKWGVGISSWGIGRQQYCLKVKNNRAETLIGSVICIESIYPDFVAGFVREGAEVLSVITNDAWYDYTIGPEQHYQIAAIRAIETRRYIARCANTGVSGFITPTGVSLHKAPQYQSVAIAATLPLLDYQSLYVRLGDFLPITAFVVCLLLLFVSFVPSVKRKFQS